MDFSFIDATQLQTSTTKQPHGAKITAETGAPTQKMAEQSVGAPDTKTSQNQSSHTAKPTGRRPDTRTNGDVSNRLRTI